MNDDHGPRGLHSSRRTVLGVAAGGAAAVTLGAAYAQATPRDPDPGAVAGPKALPPHHGAGHRPGGAPTITSDDLVFTPHTRLRPGSARQVGLDPDFVDRLGPDIARYLQPTPETPAHPEYAGATVIAAKDGVIVSFEAAGKSVRYGLDGDTVVELPADQQIDATKDTIWDWRRCPSSSPRPRSCN